MTFYEWLGDMHLLLDALVGEAIVCLFLFALCMGKYMRGKDD